MQLQHQQQQNLLCIMLGWNRGFCKVTRLCPACSYIWHIVNEMYVCVCVYVFVRGVYIQGLVNRKFDFYLSLFLFYFFLLPLPFSVFVFLSSLPKSLYNLSLVHSPFFLCSLTSHVLDIPSILILHSLAPPFSLTLCSSLVFFFFIFLVQLNIKPILRFFFWKLKDANTCALECFHIVSVSMRRILFSISHIDSSFSWICIRYLYV